jgi:hypothetical protein
LGCTPSHSTIGFYGLVGLGIEKKTAVQQIGERAGE